MRIKKINDDKVQIIITSQDLEDRDFKKWEIIPIGPKAQELFQDLLDMAYQECGFEIDEDSQLLVEAYPLTIDSFVVVMTKVRANYLSEHIHLSQPFSQEVDEDEPVERGANQVWAFDDLETCCQACSCLIPEYLEKSVLYKYDDVYYLSVRIMLLALEEINALLGEYGNYVALD
ncbi:MAG: adaptor protein MecA, partial [Peptococcia bacterium]